MPTCRPASSGPSATESDLGGLPGQASTSSADSGLEQQARIKPSSISWSRMPPLWLISTLLETFLTLQVPHRPNSQAAGIPTPEVRAVYSTVWPATHSASTSESGSGVSLRTVGTPSQACGPVVSRCDLNSTTVAGQRRFDRFPILRFVTRRAPRMAECNHDGRFAVGMKATSYPCGATRLRNLLGWHCRVEIASVLTAAGTQACWI
jgi:hypothetical protein